MLWWVFAALIQLWLMGLLLSATSAINLVLLAAGIVLLTQILRERRIL